MKRVLFVFAFVLIAGVAVHTVVQSPILASHINTIMPVHEDFESLLRRDLLAFFKENVDPTASRVEFKLLRNRPTQVGVACPKYYLWVVAYKDSKLIVQGAARVAEVESNQFDVIQFLTQAEIQSAPDDVKNIFPAALVPAILSLGNEK